MSTARTTRIRQHTFVVAFPEPQAEAIELLARELAISPETVVRNAVLAELEPKPERSLRTTTTALARRVAARRRPPVDPFQQLLD